MKLSIAVLIASLLVALSPWVISLASWGALFAPANIGALLGILGGVILAWLGKSPILPKP